MSEFSISASQGHVSPLHDKREYIPKNADVSLTKNNVSLCYTGGKTDAELFNKAFEKDVADFNAKQKKPCRKMGFESSKTERQKSYYDGIKDGTFCYGKGDQQEQAVYEVVLQIGNCKDNGITDNDFDYDHWEELKKTDVKSASEYVNEHLNTSESVERTKRILSKTSARITALDPEHLVVLRSDLHCDEPGGTQHVHLAFTLRGTDYKQGMKGRCASVKALAQMGFVASPEDGYGITQLYEKFRDITEQEMSADAQQFGYEPMTRKAPTGEHRDHLPTEQFKQLKSREDDLNAYKDEIDAQAEKNALAFLKARTEQNKRDKEYSEKVAEFEKEQADFQKQEDALESQKKAVDSMLKEAEDILKKASTISDKSLLQYTKTVKFKDGTSVYDRYLMEQDKTKADLRMRASNLFDIGNKDTTTDDYSL